MKNTVSGDLNTIYLAPEALSKNFPNGYPMMVYQKKTVIVKDIFLG